MRAHVGATAAQNQTDPGVAEAMRAEARGYLDQAVSFLHPVAPRLVAVGGVSGTGKSVLAKGLAPSLGRPPGAVHLRTDLIRKRLMGVGALERLGPGAYTAQVSKQVYELMLAQAAQITATGQSVITDAVFLRADEREAIAAAARSGGVQIDGLWLQAPEDVLMHRVAGRRGDASDADTGVLRGQLAVDQGPISWPVLDVAGDSASVLRDAETALPALRIG